MKPHKELNKARTPQLEAGTYSGYQIETKTYIFDFDIEIEERYRVYAGTKFAPQTTERVARWASVTNLTIWHKALERNLTLKPNIERFLIDRIVEKFNN